MLIFLDNCVLLFQLGHLISFLNLSKFYISDLQSLKPTQETPISNHQSQTDPSTFTTIDGNLQFPDIATSIGANKIKINLKNNVACIKPERKKYSKTNSCKTKKIVVRSKVQADEKSALCNMM